MKLFTIIVLLAFGFVSTEAEARATRHKFSITSALTGQLAKKARLPSVKYYFSSQKHATYSTTVGTWKSNKKANGFGKSDEAACQWAFLGALKSLLARAQRQGGEAVVDIISVTKNQPYKSADKYACVAGGAIVHVALEGRVVKGPMTAEPKTQTLDVFAKPSSAVNTSTLGGGLSTNVDQATEDDQPSSTVNTSSSNDVPKATESDPLAAVPAEDTVRDEKYRPLVFIEPGKWDIQMPVYQGARYENTSALLLDRNNFTLESSYVDVVGRIGLSIDAKDGILPFLLKAEFETDLVSGSFNGPNTDLGIGLSGTRPSRALFADDFVNEMLRKAYLQGSMMQYLHLLGGVMTSHWGMGLVANDGAHGWESGNARFHDPRGGDRVIRGMVASGPHGRRHQIFATVGVDKLLNDDAMFDGDEGTQIVAAFMYGRGKPKSAGVYFVSRRQVTPAQILQTAEQKFDVHVAEGVTNVNVIDATFKVEYNLGNKIGTLTVEGEAAYILGETTLGPSADIVTHKIQQLGIAGRASFAREHYGLILDFLLASGDADLNDEFQSGFKADRNYSMGLLMYRHLMAGHTGRAPVTASDLDIVGIPPQNVDRFATRGSASNTIAFFPRMYWKALKRSQDHFADLEIYGGPLIAFTAQALIDPFSSKIQGGATRNALNAEPGNYLGTEIDLGLRMRTFLFKQTELTVGAELGYLIPGDAFKSATGQEQDNVFGARAILEYRL